VSRSALLLSKPRGDVAVQRTASVRCGAGIVLSVFLFGCGVVFASCAGPKPLVDPLPGAETMPSETAAAVTAALQRLDKDASVRSRHLHEDGSPKYANRLLLEFSPYLRQHAHNPVNWYPWGDEAFDAARRLGRPVLLSIGYSTCHWCHVMEEESFEDEEIARYLNEHYVAIKVDREQRPDLDSVYMTAVQAMTGRGGWPMTMWLTASGEPFYGGTYFPARDGDRGATRGFLTVLAQVADAYRSDAAAVASHAADLAAKLRGALDAASRRKGPPVAAQDLPAYSALVLDKAATASSARFDETNGGPRGAPKFPSALPLRALLRHDRLGDSEHSLEMVTRTLDGMASGGIRDHLGGGFHRYSTDSAWLVPHFEKMLYDNALLAMAFTEAWQVTGRPAFRQAAEDILAWMRREMTSPDGAFFSATDADSRAPDGSVAEGRFFTWTPAETAQVLGADAAKLFDAAYGVTAAGNLDGRNVLHRALASDRLAMDFAMSPAEVDRSLEKSRALLLASRDARPRPLRDDKIVTAWNGLMISAAARASLAFGDETARQMAARAADFLLRGRDARGALARSSVDGREQPEVFLDDYAFLEAGLLDLFEAGDGNIRLEQAIALDAILEKDFEDPAAGGFFLTPAGTRVALAREKPLVDGAEPSGNSVAILNLLRLAELTGEQRYRDRAERAFGLLREAFADNPLSAGDALLALDFTGDTPKEIILVTMGPRATLAPLLRKLGSTFVPNRIVLTVAADAPAGSLTPLAEDKPALAGLPTAYVCEGRVCDLPTRDPEVFSTQLRRVSPRNAR